MRKVFAVVILIFASIACLFSCGKGEETVYYTVHFDVSYVSASMSVPEDLSVADGEGITLPSFEAEPSPCKTFIWTKDPLGKTSYDPASPVREDTTLYAVEVPKRYKILYLFEDDGIVNSPENPSSYDATEEIVLQAPLRTTIPFGYKFSKWSYADDPNSDVTRIEVGTTGDIVLRAYLLPGVYEIYVDGDRRGAKDPNGDYVFGTEMTLLPLDKEGFVGYTAYDDPSLTVTTLTPSFLEENKDRLLSGGVIRLRAMWSEE